MWKKASQKMKLAETSEKCEKCQQIILAGKTDNFWEM